MANPLMRNIIKSMRNYRFRSIFLRNFIALLLGVLVLISVVSWIYMGNVLDNIKEETCQINMGTLNRSADMVDQTLSQMYGLSYTLATDERILSYITIEPSRYYYDDYAKDCMRDLELLTKTFDYLDTLMIYSEASGLLLDRHGAYLPKDEDQTWLQVYNNIDDSRIHLLFQRKNNRYPYWITVICPIRLQGRSAMVGAVVLHANIEDIGQLIGDTMANGQQLYILDNDNRMYYSSDYRYIGEQDFAPDSLSFLIGREKDFSEMTVQDGEEYVVSCVHSEVTEWKYVFLSPYKAYHERINRISLFSRSLIVIIIILAVGIVFLMTELTAKPISSIMEAVDSEAAESAGGPLAMQAGKDEIESIIDRIRSMHDENTVMKEELDARMRMLDRAQMQALQTQIDPHFLYNALDTIRWMSIDMIGQDNSLAAMSEALADLLRISLDSKHYLVALSEEIRHVQAYMVIFDARYRGQIKVHYDIPDELMNKSVIKLTIQPLIENAVKHGLRPRRYSGNIWIRAVQLNSYMAITVEDDGVGMSERQITELNESLHEGRDTMKDHVGLHNVNQRIRLIYGSKCGVILSHRSEGTSVTFVVPL